MGYGGALSIILAAFTYTGGRLSGYQRDPTVDEVSRKEYLRKNRRRPVDQIVNELGEGRGRNTLEDLTVAPVGRRVLTNCRNHGARLRAAPRRAHQGGLRHRCAGQGMIAEHVTYAQNTQISNSIWLIRILHVV